MSYSNKILIVDDDPDIIEFLSYNLKKEGYKIEIGQNGLEAIEKAIKFKPDLILLDVMMPKMDGIEACEQIRSNKNISNVIIAFLSARDEDYSYVAGLNAGADDYITKPIKPRILISKVKSLLRRLPSNNTTNVDENVNFAEDNTNTGNIIIDKEKYLVFKDGKEYFFPRKEFELLALLASSSQKVFTRDEIFKTIWGDDYFVSDRTIDVHIRKIRKKIGDDIIKTVKGVGYKLVD